MKIYTADRLPTFSLAVTLCMGPSCRNDSYNCRAMVFSSSLTDAQLYTDTLLPHFQSRRSNLHPKKAVWVEFFHHGAETEMKWVILQALPASLIPPTSALKIHITKRTGSSPQGFPALQAPRGRQRSQGCGTHPTSLNPQPIPTTLPCQERNCIQGARDQH